MRLIFAGTPVFAERALSALAAAGHEIALVLTRPDQAAGRGQQLQASPVKQRALALGVPVFQPRTLRDPQAQARIAEVGAELMVVAAYGLILPEAVLTLPARGCLNIHASLLPRWRGAAPIQRAIEAGDAQTGITIMQMDVGLDTGAMRLAQALPIAPDDTAGTLHDKLADLGATLIVTALDRLTGDGLPLEPQPEAGVTYAAKIEKAESAIDWTEPAERIARRLRAFDPFPGGAAALADRPGQTIKIWQADVVEAADGAGGAAAAGAEPASAAGPAPGTLLQADPAGIVVACGAGSRLALRALQKPGGKRLPAAEFLRGFPLAAGQRLVPPVAAAAPVGKS